MNEHELPPLKPLDKLRISATFLWVAGLVLSIAFTVGLAAQDLEIQTGDPTEGTSTWILSVAGGSALIGFAALVVFAIWTYRAWENMDARTGMPMATALAVVLVVVPWINSIGHLVVAFMLLRASGLRPSWFWPWAIVALASTIAGFVMTAAGIPYGGWFAGVNLALSVLSVAGSIAVLFAVERGQFGDATGFPEPSLELK